MAVAAKRKPHVGVSAECRKTLGEIAKTFDLTLGETVDALCARWQLEAAAAKAKNKCKCGKKCCGGKVRAVRLHEHAV
jgi:hypothetical protein